jgi:hypothetical protein
MLYVAPITLTSNRMPLQPVKLLELAAFASYDITVVINRVWQYLKPLWMDRSFILRGREEDTTFGDTSLEDEEYGAFDRTLVAHCVAFNVSDLMI